MLYPVVWRICAILQYCFVSLRLYCIARITYPYLGLIGCTNIYTKLFDAFNTNKYFTGFEVGEPHHLPIEFVELHLCQSTIPVKQRRVNFRNFLLRVIRCSILFTFQSVVSLHTHACAFPIIIISCVSLDCL